MDIKNGMKRQQDIRIYIRQQKHKESMNVERKMLEETIQVKSQFVIKVVAAEENIEL